MSTLSGGEQQKVYIAMLLAQGTPIVLMDEPTTYLDISHKFDVIHLVQEMKHSGKTIVMVLHDLDLALKYADQVVLMDHGQITACGTPETVFASGKIEKTFSVHPGKMDTDRGIQYYFYP
jgi:iron complex transport system ATP-binding protein